MKKYRKLLLITMLVCFGLALKGERVEAANEITNYIHVIDSETKKPISGVNISIYDDNNVKIGNFDKSEFSVKLKQLTYYRIEISSQDDSYITNQKTFFSANEDYYEDTKDIYISMINIENPTIELSFLFFDNITQNEIKPNMKAAIYKDDTNELIDTIQIKEDEENYKLKLKKGKYRVKFSDIPKGYNASTDTVFEVDKNQLILGKLNIPVKVNFSRTTGIIKIYLKNENNALIPGGTFEIKKENSSEEGVKLTTDENGICNFTMNSVGEYEEKLKTYYQYKITAKEPPVGYRFEETEQTVSMEDGETDDNNLLAVDVTFKVTKKPVIDESKANQSTVMSGKDQQKLNNEATAEQNKKDTEETLSDQLSKLAKSVQTSDGNIKILFVAILVLACLGMIYGKKIIKEKKRG